MKYSKILKLDKSGPTQVVDKIAYNFKQHHHVRLDAEYKRDCDIWIRFLSTDLAQVVNRPMLDLDSTCHAKQIGFSSDASAGKELGFGCVYQNRWIFGK